jgi:hypothetical protein
VKRTAHCLTFVPPVIEKDDVGGSPKVSPQVAQARANHTDRGSKVVGLDLQVLCPMFDLRAVHRVDNDRCVRDRSGHGIHSITVRHLITTMINRSSNLDAAT